MNTDDKIRAILQMEADSVEPSPAGWDAISAGVADRSRRVWWVRGGALAGAVLTVAAVAVFAGADPSRQTIEPQPASPAPAPSETVAPSPSATPAPSPSPTATPDAVAYADGEALGTMWPLTTGRDVRAWLADPGTYPSLKDPKSSAMAFMRSYLGITDELVYERTGDHDDLVIVKHGGEQDSFEVTRLTVPDFGGRGTGPFVVTRAESPQLDVTAPAPGGEARSPLAVKGWFKTVDPSVLVTLRADTAGSAPAKLAEERAEFGPPADWSASLTYSTTARYGGVTAVLAGLNGTIVQGVAAVPVTFGASTTAPADTFVAARDGRIALLAATTGEVVRWLTEPGEGDYSPQLSVDRKTVVYGSTTTACTSEIRSVPVAGGRPSTLARGGQLTVPSRRNGVLAYHSVDCEADGPEVVVVAPGGTRRFPVDGRLRGGITVGERFVLYVTERDGRTMLHMPDAFGELADNPTAPPSGCQWLAATWGSPDENDREQIVAAARCGSQDGDGDTVLYRLDADGKGATRFAEAGHLLVTSLDYDAAMNRLLLGIRDAAGEPEAFVLADGLRRIPGLAEHPSW
jgi:hypothetical protein